MAYNRKNLLQLMIDVQEIYREHADRGATDRWIHREKIKPKYHISIRTMYNYLTTPAKKQLRQLEEAEQGQMQLF